MLALYNNDIIILYDHFLSNYYNISIDDSSRSCVKGFLNRQSLEMIVDAPRETTIFKFLNTTQGTFQSMPLSTSGDMLKCIIAAKFDHSEPSGWPMLQIKRSGNVTAMTQSEPKPSGYLNVFEYETLSADIRPGDVVHVWYNPESRGQRYLLAYVTVTESSVSKPLVYFNVSNNNTMHITPTRTVTSNKPYRTNSPTINSSTKPNMVSSVTSTTTLSVADPVTAIVGGVLGTLMVLMLLAFMIIIVFFIYKHVRNEKQFSPNTSRTANNRIHIGAFDNVTYTPDSILPTSDQGMSSNRGSEGGGTGATGRGAGAMSSSQNNPQEVSSNVYA